MDSLVRRAASISAALVILASAMALHGIVQGWDSLYAADSDGQHLPHPTAIVVEGIDEWMISALAIVCGLLVLAPLRQWKSGRDHGWVISYAALLVWLTFFFLVSWALTLPVIPACL